MNMHVFADNISVQIQKVRNALVKKDYRQVTNELSDICDALAKNGQSEAVAKHRAAIGTLMQKSPDEIEAVAEQIILDVISLTVDLQLAEFMNKQGKQQTQKVSGMGILAVDNAVMFLNTLKRLLANTDYELHCVTSGEEALAFLKNNQPNVILLDIEMPDMDGYELARKIKQSGQKAPIIFITANSDSEYIKKAAEVGAAGLLMKPLRVNQLLAKLKEFM
jgi:CheY-like chemotaxis protein